MNVFMVLGLGITPPVAWGMIVAGLSPASSARTSIRLHSACRRSFPALHVDRRPAPLMERQGAGWISERIAALIARFTRHHDGEQNEKAAELGIAGVVSLTNPAPPTP